MTIRLAQISAHIVEESGFSREWARYCARRCALWWVEAGGGAGLVYLHDEASVIADYAPVKHARVITSTMSESALLECKRKRLSRTVARVGGAT